MESIRVAWTTVYATGAYLSDPTGQQPWYTNPSSSEYLERTPGLDLYHATPDKSQIPDIASYVLTLTGYDPLQKGQNISKTFSLDVQKVQLAYFKYANNNEGKLSGIIFKTIPNNWPGKSYVTGQGKAAVATIQQPGSTTDTYYLGSEDKTHPQIQYFAATASDDQWTLDWVTANLIALTLDGETQTSIEKGSQVVSEPGTYTLLGTASNGETVQSVLVVS